MHLYVHFSQKVGAHIFLRIQSAHILRRQCSFCNSSTLKLLSADLRDLPSRQLSEITEKVDECDFNTSCQVLRKRFATNIINISATHSSFRNEKNYFANMSCSSLNRSTDETTHDKEDLCSEKISVVYSTSGKNNFCLTSAFSGPKAVKMKQI